MTIEECLSNWEKTGDTIYENYLDGVTIKLIVDNVKGFYHVFHDDNPLIEYPEEGWS